MNHLVLQTGSGLTDVAGQAAAVAGSIVLVLMLVALGGFAYKSLRGDGIEWPEDGELNESDDGVTRGNDDDEWDYY